MGVKSDVRMNRGDVWCADKNKGLVLPFKRCDEDDTWVTYPYIVIIGLERIEGRK